MSLAEVEEAVSSLSPAEQEQLFRLLAIRLRKAQSAEGKAQGAKAFLPIDRLDRLRKIFPDGPVKGDIQDVIDYDRSQFS